MENQKIIPQSSGAGFNDNLPLNKSEQKTWKKILLWIGVTIIILVILFFSLSRILGLFFRDIPSINDADLQLNPEIVQNSDNIYFDLKKLDEKKLSVVMDGKSIQSFLEDSSWDQNFADFILSNNTEAIKIFDESLSKSKYQDPVTKDIANINYKSVFFSLGNARSLAHIISIQSADFSRQGKSQEALDRAFQIVDLGQKIENSQGPMVNLLVSFSIKQIGIKRIQRMISLLNSPEEINFYQSKLASYKNNNQNYKNSFKVEYLYFKNSLDQMKTSIAEDSGSNLVKLKGSFYYQSNRTKQLFADNWRKNISFIDKPCKEVKQTDNIEEKKENKPSMLKLYFTQNAVGEIIYSVAGSAFSGIALKRCELNSQIENIELELANNFR